MDKTTAAGRPGSRRHDRPGRPPARPAEVLLPHRGGQIVVRAAGTADAGAGAALHGRCSVRTLEQRYRGPAADADAYLPHLLSPHFGHTLAAWSGRDRMVALGHALWDGDEAELALLVEDAWQGRGVGTALLRLLVGAAARTGRARVYAVAQPPGTGTVAVMRRLGLPWERHDEEDAVVITATTAPATGPCRAPRPCPRPRLRRPRR